MRSRLSFALHGLVALLGLALVASAILPSPYVLSTPGRIVDAGDLLEGPDATPDLSFPTVVAQPVPWLLLPYRLVRGGETELMKVASGDVDVSGAASPSDGEVERRTTLQAKAAALSAAGTKVTTTGEGVLVSATSDWPGGPPVGALLVKADGKRVRTTSDLRRILAGHKPGDRVPVSTASGPAGTIWLRPHPATAEGWWIDEDLSTAAPELGESTRELADPTVPEGILGDSHGLALALAYYARLTGEDIMHGRSVVATGAIDADGTVLPVGGVDLKVVAAFRAGADVVLVPRATYRDAYRHQSPAWSQGPSIVPVDSLEHALEVLADPPPTAVPPAPDGTG